MVSEAEVAQYQAFEAVQAAEDIFALDAVGRLAANGLGQTVERTLGRTADIEQPACLVPMQPMQVPRPVDGVLRRRPAGDRKSVVEGKSVSVRVGLGGGRINKKNT